MRNIFLLVAFIGLLSSPGLLAIAPAAPSEDQGAAQEDVDAALAEMIDTLAGHPDDPQLPQTAFGASDEALLATDSREVADLLEVSLAFAQERAKSPRFLFALGRAAIAHGYERRGKELLTTASQRGSAAAFAYLGYVAEADGDNAKAASYLRQAIEKGFDSPAARETLAMLSGQQEGKAPGSRFNAALFNRPDWVQALYDDTPAPLEDAGLVALTYAGGLHNTLWASDILFLAEDPVILLELDPNFSVQLGKRMVSSPGTMQESFDIGMESFVGMLGAMAETRREGGGIASEFSAGMSSALEARTSLMLVDTQAVQDARRLAILYNTDPDSFRRIYHGLRTFVYGSSPPHSRVAQPKTASSSFSSSGTGVENRGREVLIRSGNTNPREPWDKNPVALYAHLNRDSQNLTPVFFRTGTLDAFIYGKDSRSGDYRLEPIRLKANQPSQPSRAARQPSRVSRGGRQAKPQFEVSSNDPGVLFAMKSYGHEYATIEDVVAAAGSAKMRPEWHPDGAVGQAVTQYMNRRAIDDRRVSDRAALKERPLFFCPTKESDVVTMADARSMEVVFVQGLQDHLAFVDAVIAESGSFFGKSREDHIRTVLSDTHNHVVARAMREWPNVFPNIDTFLELAAKAEVRPEYYR